MLSNNGNEIQSNQKIYHMFYFFLHREEANLLHAAMVGVANAIPLIANIAANLVAFYSFIAFGSYVFNWACTLAGAEEGTCSIEVNCFWGNQVLFVLTGLIMAESNKGENVPIGVTLLLCCMSSSICVQYFMLMGIWIQVQVRSPAFGQQIVRHPALVEKSSQKSDKNGLKLRGCVPNSIQCDWRIKLIKIF